MKKEDKRIIRFRTGATNLQGAAYLKEMAEQGWILEEMSHLTYSFREDEPQYLRYRMEEREHALTEEERAEYARDGWQEVCHYELEYIFAKERASFEDDAEEDKEEIIKELDWKIQQEAKNEKTNRYGQLIVIGTALVASVLALGFSKETLYFALRLLIRLAPFVVIGYFASRRRTKELRQEQERVREGDISDDYTDWRKSRKATIIVVCAVVLGLGVWVFYEGEFNEKTFDMPAEISYEEIPAVRLENLLDMPLQRAGRSIDPKMEGIRLNANIGEGIMYENLKKIGGFDNYGVDHRFLLKTEKKVETHQYMQTEDKKEVELDTMYYRFRDVRDAAEEYLDLIYSEEEMDEIWKEKGIDFPKRQLIVFEGGQISNQHICKREWSEGTAYHVVCFGEDNQVMGLNYYYSNGEVTVEQLLEEIAKVFAAQTK